MVVRSATEALGALGVGQGSVLVACSGGLDSTVLLDVLEELGWNSSIGHVNHGLRGEESEADELFLRQLAEERGLAFRAERIDPRALREGGSSRTRPTLQEAARRLRYDALERLADAEGARWIATAHNADDQAETVLLRLLRGVGPDGLAGIPARAGRVLRPLLRVSRSAIEVHARARDLRWREDPSNQSPVYARNRVRPLIRRLQEDFNPKLLRAIGDLAEAQSREREWIDGLVAREADSRFVNLGESLVIEGKDWSVLPEALARRLVREALRRCGAVRDVSRSHVERMVAFMREGRPGTEIQLPGGLVLRRDPEVGGSFRLRASLFGTKR